MHYKLWDLFFFFFFETHLSSCKKYLLVLQFHKCSDGGGGGAARTVWGWGDRCEKDTSFSFHQPALQQQATKQSVMQWCLCFWSAYSLTRWFTIHRVCSRKQASGGKCQDTPPRGLVLDSLFICNFILPLTEQSLAMDPKHLIKTYLRCALVRTSASGTLQSKTSHQKTATTETNQKNPQH